ncbi:MAG: endonuclease [Armatimonadota bacterium]
MVYLIHFERAVGTPRKRAQHYLGYAEDLPSRLDTHRQGRGARLLQVVQLLGIRWRVVRTWDGDRARERQLKRWKKSRTLCPVCRGKEAF